MYRGQVYAMHPVGTMRIKSAMGDPTAHVTSSPTDRLHQSRKMGAEHLLLLVKFRTTNGSF